MFAILVGPIEHTPGKVFKRNGDILSLLTGRVATSDFMEPKAIWAGGGLEPLYLDGPGRSLFHRPSRSVCGLGRFWERKKEWRKVSDDVDKIDYRT